MAVPPPSGSRPAVDVVVPFRGIASERSDTIAAMTRLRLCDGDSLTVVDNGPKPPPGEPALLHAGDVPSSYFARNRGAERGTAEWIVFLDADVRPEPDLLDRYFARPPDERVAILAGGVDDERRTDLASLPPAARYAATRAPMSQEKTLVHGEWGYAQTANVAIRRSAFEAVGGFREDVRSAGDADLCFRLRKAGWQLETRPAAAVLHRNRTTLRALVRQRARHGSGAAWLNREYPGSFPRRPRAMWTAYKLREALGLARGGSRAEATVALVAIAFEWSYELGRLLPNRVRPRRA